MKLASINGNTSSMELTSIESIVLENNNLVFKTNACEDNYHNVFFNQNLTFSDVSTSTDKIETPENPILVYPNPASNSLTISKTSEDSSEGYIYNVRGKVLMSFNLQSQTSTVDISSLSPGLYFLLLDNQSTKFIKQ